MQTVILYLALFGLALALPALAITWICMQDAHPLLDAASRIRRLPKLVQLAIAAFVAHLIVYGSSKTNSPPMRIVGDGTQTVFGFTPEQFAAGFVMSRVGFGESWGFALGAGMSVVGPWRLRGAADDIASCPPFAPVSDAPAVFSDGRVQDSVRSPQRLYAPLHAPLGVVPEANWGLVAKTNAQSMVWLGTTASNSLVVTWRDVLLQRETNMPVSVQAEFFENGNFEYRYDLESVKCRIENEELDVGSLTNVTIGASLGGAPFKMSLAELATSATAAAFNSPFSISFVALADEDSQTADRDGDGISTYDEIFTYRTDPGLVDTSGDGISDGAAVALGLDPLLRHVPDADILARVAASATNGAFAANIVATNSLVSWKLFDGFAAEVPQGTTNVIWERTFRINRTSAWQQFFVSASPTGAASWRLEGMRLEWDAGEGACGAIEASPYGDSFRIPLATNDFPSALTLRLRTIGGFARSPAPLHFIAYASEFSVVGGTEISGPGGRRFHVFTEGSDSSIRLVIDSSRRPCLAPLADEACGMAEFGEMAARGFAFDGDVSGGTIRASRPGTCALPDVSLGVLDVSTPQSPMRGIPAPSGEGIIVIDPSVRWECEGHGCDRDGLGYDWDGDCYYEEDRYPLDSKCLRRKWYRDWSGGWTHDSCVLAVSSGMPECDGVTTSVDGNRGAVLVYGVEVWSGEAEHVYDDTCIDWYAEDVLGDGCDGCDSDCADGNCDSLEGSSLGSLKFRIPLGAPVKEQVAGFAWFSTDGPVAISKSIFQILEHPCASISVTTESGVRRIVCHDLRGRDLRIEDIADGARITIYDTAAQTLEHIWEIVNVNGSASQVRLRKISRLNNVMSDETYTYDDGDWTRFDNVAGVGTLLTICNGFADYGDGVKSETRTLTDASGNVLSLVTTEQSRVGECDNAVLRETYREEHTGMNFKCSWADYWNDPAHSGRHGRPRLVWGDARAWVYADYDDCGHETLRVEQRGGDALPSEFPCVVSNELQNASTLEDAFVTVRDFTPLPGDTGHQDDAARPRTETRYVVTNSVATLIGRTWTRYTRFDRDGYAAVKRETWRAADAQSAALNFSTFQPLNFSTGIAYSYEITYADTGDGTPLLMRNAAAETLDEDGVLTVNSYSLSGGVLIQMSHKSYMSHPLPAYEVVERDASYGTVLRRTTRLADGDAVIADEQSIYDSQNRLRSTTYLDGTSLTNAYSCCRLLWSRDREGCKTLRSAETGTDHLYNAMEDVWLADVSTNGQYRVTQRFYDALGRETNTVVGTSHTPGASASPTSALHSTLYSLHSFYPYGGSDYSVKIDERGKVTTSRTYILGSGIASVETVYTNDVEVMSTTSSSSFDGGSSTRREWGGDKWTDESRFEDYAADGKRIEYVVTESSDYGVVTNSVATYDLLGRLVSKAVPGANGSSIVTANTYDGASTRILATTYTAGDVVRTTTYLYDDFSEQVGTVLDGITSREETTYETDASNVVWKVVSSSLAGPYTNSLAIVRTRLTGLSDSCRRHTVELAGTGVTPACSTETHASYDPATDIETETVTSSVAPSIVRRYRHGVLLSEETVGTTMFNTYDAFGRAAATLRSIGNSQPLPIQAFDYAPCGDIMAMHTYTNGTDFVTEAYGYDMLGNNVAMTDALGNTVFKSYDPFGNVVAEWGATYPVRFAYDTEGRRTLLSTTRDGTIWDVTTWEYDPATGRCTAKRYADGSSITYTYTPDNLPLRTTFASGRWMENVYDERRQVVAVEHSDGETVSLAHDAFSNEVAASNGVAFATFERDASGNCTNDTTLVGGESKTIERKFDAFRRLVESDGASYVYNEDGSLASISNAIAVVEYVYTPDHLDSGYSLTIFNGVVFTRSLERDDFRRSLVTGISSHGAGAILENLAYTYDSLNRPTSRNDDAFSYNARGEVVFSRRGYAEEDSYAYDDIGNLLISTCNSSTNTYTANSLNQYTSILRSSAPPREVLHDIDGNMLSDGNLSFAYDAANRLKAVSSNGVLFVTNFYDAKSRRVKKVTSEATTTFFYDDWNLIEERVAYTNGTSSTISYYWGKDLSGTLQGAGGVGGLLYLTVNGVPYIPCYDCNGNITRYLDANGSTVAQYTYDAFGKIVAQSGPLVDFFRHRFSTKYFDPETGLYYYGYRFYSPTLMRWLNRDPIEEDGGLNLYGFCRNNSLCGYDELGLEWVIERNSSKRWAIARKSSRKDTIMSLADKLKLDFSERAKWLRRNKDNPCLFEVPNVFCVYTSKSGWLDNNVAVVTHLKRKAVSDSERYKSKGFMIVSHKWADSDDTFIDMWTEDGIYAVSFGGHGTVYGFKAETSSDTAVAPDLVCPPYHLAAVSAYSCVSAMYIEGGLTLPNGKTPRYSWRNHVSPQGTFVGYNGKVYWFNLSKQEVSINEAGQ